MKKETLEAADNIGNLLAISYKTNSKLGNALPSEKLTLLTGKLAKEVENLQYVKEFIATYGPDAKNWDESKIQGRAKDMAMDAYKRVWKIA